MVHILDTELDVVRNQAVNSKGMRAGGLFVGARFALSAGEIFLIAKAVPRGADTGKSGGPQKELDIFMRNNPGMAIIGEWRKPAEDIVEMNEEALLKNIDVNFIKSSGSAKGGFIASVPMVNDDQFALAAYFLDEKTEIPVRVDINEIDKEEAFEFFKASMQAKAKKARKKVQKTVIIPPEREVKTTSSPGASGSFEENRLAQEVAGIEKLPGVIKCNIIDVDENSKIVHIEIKDGKANIVFNLTCTSAYPKSAPTLFIDKIGEDSFTSEIVRNWSPSYKLRDVVLEFLGFVKRRRTWIASGKPGMDSLSIQRPSLPGVAPIDAKTSMQNGEFEDVQPTRIANRILLIIAGVSTLLFIIFAVLFFRQLGITKKLQAQIPDEVVAVSIRPGQKKHTPVSSKKPGTMKKPSPVGSKKPVSPASSTPTKKPAAKPSPVVETPAKSFDKVTIKQDQKLLFINPKFSGAVFGRGAEILNRQTPWDLVGRNYPGLNLGEEEVHLDQGNEEKKSMEYIEKSMDEDNMGAAIIFTYKTSPNQKRLVENLASLAKKKGVPLFIISLQDSPDGKDKTYFDDSQHFIPLYRKSPVTEDNFKSKLNDELEKRIKFEKKK